ncbi:MAG TPA: biopolymer transporter ExbD [Steroidobacteraceae bacterium]|nr:biopolymer transporter ExbD [Steroidobacteraceae bacterium]
MSGQSFAAEPQLNATPLIDVMLVLLVILIITLPLGTHAVKLDLPRGVLGPPVKKVHLDIAYGGDIYLNGEHIKSLEQLAPRLALLAARADPPPVEVVPDKLAPYERVAQVLAAAQRAHIRRLSIRSVPDR